MTTEWKQKTMIQIAKIRVRKNKKLNTKRKKAREKEKRNYHWKLRQQPTDFSSNSRAPEYGGPLLLIRSGKKKE